MPKRLASLSLDLDNQWSYLKTHGDAGWESFPSYLDVVVPRVLDTLARRDLKITFFIVGQDAALAKNQNSLRMIADAGHEIGNHSFHHEPWLHLYSDEKLDAELAGAEEAILEATGTRPVGFRGPGFSLSDSTLRVLQRREYQYDGSTFPTYLGPLARAYYFMTARLDKEQKRERKQLFGKLSDGFRPLRPFRWDSLGLDLVEIPVTTMPITKVPVHLSYVLYLAQYSPMLAVAYFRKFLILCRLMGIEPSVLLHPLDFLGCDDHVGLGFFPGMRMEWKKKMGIASQVIDLLRSDFDVVPMVDHARACRARLSLPLSTAH